MLNAQQVLGRAAAGAKAVSSWHRPVCNAPVGVAQTLPLADLLGYLHDRDYRFTTPTPLTHQRVLTNRGAALGTTLCDIFGWSLPFEASALPPALLAAMDRAGVLLRRGDVLASTVRVARLGGDLFVHSAYPTTQDDAVFFGPDTYRFCSFIKRALDESRPHGSNSRHGLEAPVRVLDVGCGSGAGGIVAARALASRGTLAEVSMNDINPLALRFTAANAAAARLGVTLAPGDALSAVSGQFDLVVSNPPYLMDVLGRAYRHGGARLGRALSVRIATEALSRLAPGGQLLLYTGVAIEGGADPFLAELLPVLARTGAAWSYAEIDPDVFGEELSQPAYAHIDRIAAVGLVASRKAEGQ